MRLGQIGLWQLKLDYVRCYSVLVECPMSIPVLVETNIRNKWSIVKVFYNLKGEFACLDGAEGFIVVNNKLYHVG